MSLQQSVGMARWVWQGGYGKAGMNMLVHELRTSYKQKREALLPVLACFYFTVITQWPSLLETVTN